ncbi:MAG: 30S ribosome-binding factor RbfA [Pseudanabaenaceae cyanobacterium]
MADQRRVARVAEQIKREVGSMLLRDIKDDRVGVGMVSVTEVEVSGDLRHAKIFVSIYGTESDRQATMAGLLSVTGFVRRELAKRLTVRFVPEIVFCEDRSLERGAQILALLDRLAEERAHKEQSDP